MAWQEMFSISNNFIDSRDEELVGRTDDWVIPLRGCIDTDNNVNTNIHKQLNFRTSNSPSVYYNNKIYVFHGFIEYIPTQDAVFDGYATRAYMYDPSSASGNFTNPLTDYRITHIRPIPYPAYDSAACVHDTNIHIFGGQRIQGGTLSSLHYKYNPNTDSYTQLASMPSARQGHSAISVGSYIYVMGGSSTTMWRYDIDSDSWSTMASMPSARDSFGVVEYNNKIYVFGGSVGSTYQNSIHVYTISTNSWTTLASSKNMPTARRHLKVERVGDVAVCFGGSTSTYVDSAKVEYFNLNNETWNTTLDDLPETVGRHCSGVYNGYVYSLFGWRNDSLLPLWRWKIHRLDLSGLLIAPSAPSNLSSSNIQLDSADIQWDLEAFAVHYDIQYGTVASGTLTTISNIKGTKYTLLNLSQGTEYRVKVRAKNSKYTSAYSSYIYFTTQSPPSIPTNLTAGSPPRVDAGLNVVWNSSSYATSYRVRIKLGSGGTYTDYTTASTSYSFTGLTYGDTYYISVRAENPYAVSSYTSDAQLTTAPKTPSITGSSLDNINNRVSITIGGMEGNYSFFRIRYRNVTDSGAWIDSSNLSIGSHWVEGLTSGKEYEFKVSSFYTINAVDIESRDASGNIGYSDSVFYTINARPDNWAWSYNIASGQNVYSVVNKTINIMLATEWNSFTIRINNFRVYKSLSNYSFTTVSGGTDVTKEIINEALSAIRDLSAHFTGGNTLIPNRITGDNILEANIYINMRDCLNSIT